MFRSPVVWRAAVGVTLTLLLAVGGRAAEDKPKSNAQKSDERKTIEPAADKAVKSAMNYLAKRKTFQAAVTLKQKVTAQGQNFDMDSHYDLAVRRPDHLAFVLK